MAHTSTTISAPVSAVADVQVVLGLSSTSTTGKESYLCGNTHGLTNKWAKYKPVILSNVSPTRTSTWYKGTAGNFGLDFTKRTTLANIVSDYNGGTNWDYLPPIGYASSPYRIGDFGGYNHNAMCFVQGLNYPLSYQKGSGSGITIDIQWRTDLASNTISISDLGFSTWYFGVIVVGNGVTRLIVNNTQISTNAMSSVLIPDAVLTVNNTYKIYPIISAQYLSSYGGNGTTTASGYTGLYTLPVSVGSVKITETVETSLNIKGGSVTVTYSTTRYTVGFTLQLILTSGYSMTNLKLQVSQSNERDGTYTNVGSQITLNPSSMTGSGSTVKEQAYSNVQASISSGTLLNTNFVKLTVTGTNASRTYTAVAIKQMRGGQEIPLIE